MKTTSFIVAFITWASTTSLIVTMPTYGAYGNRVDSNSGSDTALRSYNNNLLGYSNGVDSSSINRNSLNSYTNGGLGGASTGLDNSHLSQNQYNSFSRTPLTNTGLSTTNRVYTNYNSGTNTGLYRRDTEDNGSKQ